MKTYIYNILLWIDEGFNVFSISSACFAAFAMTTGLATNFIAGDVIHISCISY